MSYRKDVKSLPGAPHNKHLSEGIRIAKSRTMSPERRALISRRFKKLWKQRKQQGWKRRESQRA
jgi:hypothetical protein